MLKNAFDGKVIENLAKNKQKLLKSDDVKSSHISYLSKTDLLCVRKQCNRLLMAFVIS